jgi:hypothetical protein
MVCRRRKNAGHLMKKLSDYIFGSAWQPGNLGMKPYEEFVVLFDLGDLKKGAVVKFIGFDDVDNHYGIFVFVDQKDKVLEVSGDCSGPNNSCLRDLRIALSRI